MQTRPRNRFSTKGYSATKIALAIGATIYVIVADWGGRVSPRGEFFPVFNWSLFTHVDPYPLLAELHVISIGGERFEKPLNYFALGSYYEGARRRSSGLSKTVVRLHIALRLKRRVEAEHLRKILELSYLSGHGPVEYEIRSVRFSPVERWRNKRYVGEHTVMGRFRMEDAS